MTAKQFKKTIYTHYKNHRRDFPWRNTNDPYRILVSEIMLQQTQTHRVLPKYQGFIKMFPTFAALHRASFKKVLRAWSGLGYNRRALALKKIAARVQQEYGGRLPDTTNVLESFPGIGPHTAGAIAAFVYNTPAVFIETNVRTVFIYHFFKGEKKIHDEAIRKLVEKTLDKKNPREWYYALMDYGAMLKKIQGSNNPKSAHYRKQSLFKNSNRYKRGLILKMLLKRKTVTVKKIKTLMPPQEAESILLQLEKEGMVKKVGNRAQIT